MRDCSQPRARRFCSRSSLSSESTKLLTPETCKLFRENMTPGLEEARSIGWQLAATKDSTGGVDLPPDSFGHNGFTGTCVWIDPSHRRVFILLTNRTHAHALPFANINAVRREFNSLAIAAARVHADKRRICVSSAEILRLKSESQRGSDHIQIAGHAHAIILSQIIEILREVLVENLARHRLKTDCAPSDRRSSRKTLHQLQTTTDSTSLGPTGCST